MLIVHLFLRNIERIIKVNSRVFHSVNVFHFLLAIKLADDDGADEVVLLQSSGLLPANTLSILLCNSSTVFVTAVTISMGVPFFPIKNNDGSGTSLSVKKKLFGVLLFSRIIELAIFK